MTPEGFESSLSSSGLFSRADRLLLAVSGGVDSMVMYDLLWRLGYDIAVAHCNFSLRGAESDTETELVRKVASERGTPLFIGRFDTRGVMRGTGLTMQEAARRLRYGWFGRLAAENGFTRIVIAHNLNDSVETFFINAFRGTGLRGLTGIAITRGNVVRPLLPFTRAEIEEYARTGGVEWLEDSSNASDNYLRNRLRHHLIPCAEDIEPDFLATMSGNVRRLSEAASFIDYSLASLGAVSRIDGYTTIDLGLLPENHLHFALFELLRPYSFNDATVRSIMEAYRENSSGLIFTSPLTRASLHSARLTIADKPYRPLSFSFSVLDRSEVVDLKRGKEAVLLDFDLLTLPLTIRRWRDGDDFAPFGMRGRKKVGDYMTDIKKNLFERETQLVAETTVNGRSEIVWLVGERGSELTKITSETKKILQILVF